MQKENLGRLPENWETPANAKNLGKVLAEIEIAKSNGDLKQIVSILHFNKSILTKRLGKVEYVISFRKLKDYIDEQFISNKMNREEELYDSKSYKNKISHIFRYVDAISRKSHLQLSYVGSKGNILYISDDGTMMSLAFGKFYDYKILNGEDFEKIISDITEEYDLDGTEELVSSIQQWIDGLNPQQKSTTYSLKDILVATKKLDYFLDTSILYEINPFTTKQHIKDQQNANLQPNAWIAHNFYKAPIKANHLYETVFLGDELNQNIFTKVSGFGVDINKRADRLFRTYGNKVKRAAFDIPFYVTFGALIKTDDFNAILDNNQYFVDFHKHEDKTVGAFWYGAYESLVEDISYEQMKSHVEDFVLIQNDDWNKINDAIRDIKASVKLTSLASFEDFNAFKDDFAEYIIYVIMALHKLHPNALSRTKSTNILKIKEKIISYIVKYLNGTTEIKTDNNKTKTVSLITAFQNDGYRSWDKRFELVWKPAIKSVYSEMTTKTKEEKVFDKEVANQKSVIARIVKDNDLPKLYVAYSHTNEELIKIDFNNSDKCMHGLHCVSRDSGGTAADGVIWGLAEDNGGSWKYKELTFETPAEYWGSLAERNIEMLDMNKSNLTKSDIRLVEKFIDLCTAINHNGLPFLYKKTINESISNT